MCKCKNLLSTKSIGRGIVSVDSQYHYSIIKCYGLFESRNSWLTAILPTLLTQSFGNHLFAYHLVLKHPHTNMILSSFCFPSRKKCHKNFENRFINKNLTPKNDLDLVFYMCKLGGNQKILNLEF